MRTVIASLTALGHEKLIELWIFGATVKNSSFSVGTIS
jgi:hypothetical protein